MNDTGTSSRPISVSAESVSLYYFATGVLTADAGQAAGTVVVGKLANTNVRNNLGNAIGSKFDTSISMTSTALTTEVNANMWEMEEADRASLYDRATRVTANMSNGDYCVDYVTGFIFGKKADNTTTVTVSYKVAANLVTADSGSTLAVSIAPSATAGADSVFSTALEPSHVVKASAGTLYELQVRIDKTINSGTFYVQILNYTSVPANGAVNMLWAPVKVIHYGTDDAGGGADDLVTISFGANGLKASTGIVVCVSTTEFTKTIAGNVASISALYK